METRSLRANVIDRLALTMVTLSALAAALIVAGVLALAGTYPDADAAAMATLVAATPSSSESRTAGQRGGGYIARAAPGMSLEEGFAAEWRVHYRPTPGEVQFVDEPALFGDSSRDGMTPALSPEAVRVIIEGPASHFGRQISTLPIGTRERRWTLRI